MDEIKEYFRNPVTKIKIFALVVYFSGLYLAVYFLGDKLQQWGGAVEDFITVFIVVLFVPFYGLDFVLGIDPKSKAKFQDDLDNLKKTGEKIKHHYNEIRLWELFVFATLVFLNVYIVHLFIINPRLPMWYAVIVFPVNIFVICLFLKKHK